MSKRTPNPTDDLDDLFSGIDAPTKKTTTTKKPSSKPAAATDILADLESQLSESPSRPHTPRPATKPLVRRGTAGTPPTERKSTESTRGVSPAPVKKEGASSSSNSTNSSGGGGGWWGFVAVATQTATETANRALKAAEQAAESIRENDEAMKWAEQVRGNVGALKGLSDELRTRAMPTFTNFIHTLAPPISSHERLHIHIAHDFVGYPSLSPLIYSVFSRVMAQVEGGDLLVVQRGSETGKTGRSEPGWHDGPWWRVVDSDRDMGVIKGLVEGSKLCRANAEAFAHEFFGAKGGIEKIRQELENSAEGESLVRTSDIFLSVQAVCFDANEELFGGRSADKGKKEDENTEEELIQFAIYLHDPIHEITYQTLSQTIPAQWIDWLEANPTTPTAEDEEAGVPYEIAAAPEEIRVILESGGVDPREWVSEWVEETLSLAVGVVAQRYVARRMDVGMTGRRRLEEVIKDGAGEVARAGLL